MHSILRSVDALYLRHTYSVLSNELISQQKSSLIESPAVVAYFRSMKSASDNEENDAVADEDFS